MYSITFVHYSLLRPLIIERRFFNCQLRHDSLVPACNWMHFCYSWIPLFKRYSSPWRKKRIIFLKSSLLDIDYFLRTHNFLTLNLFLLFYNFTLVSLIICYALFYSILFYCVPFLCFIKKYYNFNKCCCSNFM